MVDQKQQTREYKEIDGFRDWKYFFQFIGEKYSDVSVAIVQKNFQMARETMRELIDNSSPYHSSVFQVKIKPIDEKYIKGKNDAEYFEDMFYPQYYELIVDELDKAIDMEDRPTLAPHEKEILAQAKDSFMKKSRELRRMIMADLSVSGIIPQAVAKKKRELNESLEGVGL